MLKIKKWVREAACGKTSFSSDGRESVSHDNIILAANAKVRFDVYSFISPSLLPPPPSFQELGSWVGKFVF